MAMWWWLSQKVDLIRFEVFGSYVAIAHNVQTIYESKGIQRMKFISYLVLRLRKRGTPASYTLPRLMLNHKVKAKGKVVPVLNYALGQKDESLA